MRPPQTNIIITNPQKHLSQIQTLKLHMNLCNNHHRGRVTTLQRWRSTILLPKLTRETNLAFLEDSNTTYALILSLISQRYTDTDVCLNFIPALFVCHSYSAFLPLFCIFFAHTSFKVFLWGHLQINKQHQLKLTEMHNSKFFTQCVSTSLTIRTSTRMTGFGSTDFCSKSLRCFAQINARSLRRTLPLWQKFSRTPRI